MQIDTSSSGAVRGPVLDATDQKLVLLLQADARQPVAALARQVNLSRPAVQARIARLEREGILAGYVAVVGRAMHAGVEALISLRLGVRPCGLVLDRLKTWPEVVSGYSVAGPIDAVLVCRTTSSEALSRLIDRLATDPGVTTVESAPILDSWSKRLPE